MKQNLIHNFFHNRHTRIFGTISLIFIISLGNTISLEGQMMQSPFMSGKGDVFRSAAVNRYNEVSPYSKTEIDRTLLTLPTLIPQDITQGEISLTGDLFGQSGVRAPYEGKNTFDGKLSGSGTINFKGKGRLCGYIGLGLGEETKIGYSAIRHPEYYLPYIVADSSGGDFRYERYVMGGLYALRRGASEIGFGLHFAGEIAYKYEDPRIYNTIGSLQASVGYTHHLRNIELSATIHGLYHRQYMNLWLWRPSQQDKFHLTYGFGMVNVRNTPIFFGISRMHYMGGGAVDLLLRTKKSKKRHPQIIALLSYRLNGIRTEESSSMGLFGHYTHQLNFKTHTKINRWQLALNGSTLWRLGTEYIYADYQPDEGHLTITDNRLIDTEQSYSLAEYLLQVKAFYSIPLLVKQSLVFGVGGNYFAHRQRYKTNTNHIAYNTIIPWLSIGYSSHDRFVSTFSTAYRFPLTSIYIVEHGYKDQLDYQLAYLPLVARLKKGFEFRWKSSLRIPLHKRQALSIVLDAFFAPEELQKNRPIYKGRPTTVSGIFSHPEMIATTSHTVGCILGLTYHF